VHGARAQRVGKARAVHLPRFDCRRSGPRILAILLTAASASATSAAPLRPLGHLVTSNCFIVGLVRGKVPTNDQLCRSQSASLAALAARCSETVGEKRVEFGGKPFVCGLYARSACTACAARRARSADSGGGYCAGGDWVEALDGAHLENRLDPEGVYMVDAGPSGATPTRVPAVRFFGTRTPRAPALEFMQPPASEDTQWRCADDLVRCFRRAHSARPCDGRHRLVAPETRGEWLQPILLRLNLL
jgi:hypothetical protein